MNFLLTGGAGYIGSHAALSLLDAGHNVHIIDDLSTGNESLIPKNAFFTKCNINDEEVISDLIKSNSFDLLMHFAGFIQVEESVKYPQKYFDNNTENATKLFETCKKNGLNKIVFSSTAAAYGSVSENKLIDELPTSHDFKILDISVSSHAVLEKLIGNSDIVLWNGPMGMIEDNKFSKGSVNLAHLLAKSQADVVIGGGDTILAINMAEEKFENFYFVSTAGGAFLEALENKDLPGIQALMAD